MTNYYPLTQETEIEIARAEATKPRFHDALGYAIDASKIQYEPARLIVAAAQAVSSRVGHCDDFNLVIQELKVYHFKGKVTHEQLEACKALQGEPKDLESLISAITSVIKEQAYSDALDHAVNGIGDPDALEASLSRLERVSQIGRVNHGGEGKSLPETAEDFLGCVRGKLEDPLGFGVPELDYKLHGGLERRGLGVIMAGTGIAKSMSLCHVMAEAIFRGVNGVYVTLELPVEEVKSRISRNLVNMSVKDILQDPETAVERMRLLRERPEGLGELRIVYKTPHATTVPHLKTWLKDLQKETNLSPDVLCIDPVDNLTTTQALRTKNSSFVVSGYKVVNEVFTALRDLVNERNGYVWGASQVGRGKNRGEAPGVDDIADGMGKVRLATLVLAAYRTKEDEETGDIRIAVAKRTAIETHGEVGPISTDFDKGRIAQVNRRYPWGT